MTAFMEESSTEARNGHFKAITLCQGPLPNLQFTSPQIRDYLLKRDRLAKQRNVCSAETVISNFTKRGGNAPMV